VFDAVRIRLRLRMASAEDEPGNEMKGDTLMAGPLSAIDECGSHFRPVCWFCSDFSTVGGKTKGQP
jgi:hypothetical protein